jgi:hypothetical protein
MPKFPSQDPDYRIIQRVPSRFLHYCFYIRDPVIGPLAMCVGTYLPFQTTYYLNGHNFIAIELRHQGVASARMTTRSCRPRPEGMASGRRPPELVHHRKAPELLDLAAGSEVFGKGPQGRPSEAGLLNKSNRILPELHLPTEFPPPQDFRTILRARPVPADRRPGGSNLWGARNPAVARQTVQRSRKAG